MREARYHARMTTNSSLNADGSKQKASAKPIVCCRTCGSTLADQSGRSERCRPCYWESRRTRETRVCGNCGEPVTRKPGQFSGKAVVYCSHSCASAALHASLTPEKKQEYRERMRELATSHPGFLKNYERMHGATNPMKSPEVRARVSKALAGVSRKHLNGGNGTGLTAPQALLLDELGTDWYPEYCLWARGYVHDWPLMLLDLALPSLKVAVEVDGVSHNTHKARIRDAKKERLLSEHGWRVLRVTNDSVRSDVCAVANKVREFFGLCEPTKDDATI